MDYQNIEIKAYLTNWNLIDWIFKNVNIEIF